MEHPTLGAQLERYQDHFPGPHLELVCASIVAGNTAGRLWVLSRRDGPPLLLLWDKGNNVFYLAGDGQAPRLLAQLRTVVATHLRPQALAEGRAHFKVRALSASLEAAVPRIFSGVALRAYPTVFHLSAEATLPAEIAPPRLPAVTVVPLTPAMLTRGGLAQRDDVRAEIRWMWPSEEHFFAHGFGTLAIAHDQIICWCTAEYVGPQRCGVGIATLPPYERRGVATATAACFVQEAQKRGLTACWECGQANQGSLRVAEKVGFVRQDEELYWAGSFAP